MRKRTLRIAVGAAALVTLTGAAVGSWMWLHPEPFVGKFAGGDPDQQLSSATTPGEDPVGGFEAYLSAARTYPANEIPPQVVANAKATFQRIALGDAQKGDPGAKGHKWNFFGPLMDAIQPGVTSFSGATNTTASRVTAMAVSPSCSAAQCRIWIGAAGGGVWRTDNALASNPDWKQLHPGDLDQASVGALVLDPTDKTWSTIYLGTGEGNRCSSGCEAGVGIYKSTNNGETWTKLADKCVSNPTNACANSGDAFLGRGINAIVIDPRNANHIFVGSARGVRGLSHVIGSGGTVTLEPGANLPGLYESTDGGATFTMVWDGAKPDTGPQSLGVTDLGLDPLNLDVVYVSAFDAGVYRRDAGAAQTAFSQVFAPQFFQNAAIDRTMFALTVKNNQTRIYLTDGTANGGGIGGALAANFWRLDNANQSAATLLASQGTCVAPVAATHTFPATYNTWQCLTSKTTSNPYFATDDFCTGQCWYDEKVYTPAGIPDTVYVIGSNQYGEQPCDTNGVGCGNGRSNGREVLYSDTAGDPDGSRADLRTFTDLSYDSTINHPSWCAFAPYFDQGCVNAPNGIHPDQHVIAINPANPTQIFEGSDGGLIRTSGAFADISSQCDSPFRNGGTPLPSTSGSYLSCKRLLSRVPTLIEHMDKKLSSTLQFINVAINPSNSGEIMGGTQDNGTWSNIGSPSANTFTQVIYGDGGNAGYDGTNPTWRFNEFTSGFSDANFRNGDPEKWVIISAPIVNSGEGPSFYWPQIGDPNPVPGTHPIFSGAKHVWRSWAFGAGHAGSVPQDSTPDIASYETNCPEFVVGGNQDGCGDFRPLGGPYCDGLASTLTIPSCINQPGDLTGTVYGADRGGGSISWLARDGADHGTLWAATSAGRIFVTHNADASDPATVTWHRIDSSTAGDSPTRFPSGIYVDPADTGHAWVTYSGYNAATPSTPGHVFEVKENGTAAGSGIFTNLNVEAGTGAFPTPTNDGDLPVSDVARDDANQTLYVSTDFGVLRGDSDGKGGWHVTAGMPNYEVMHLEIQPSSRVPTCTGGAPGCKHVLFAATHSRGIWQMNLGN